MARWAALLVLAVAAAIAAMASVAGGDMSADKTECAGQLVGLAPCLQYVQGQARAPPPDCCGGLRQVLGKSPKGLCVLVRDKDDPGLGIRINATLALALPSACGATRANVSRCAQLLHIPPGSKDAAIFSPGSDKDSNKAAPGKDNSRTDSRALQATNGGRVSRAASAGMLVPELSASSSF